MINISAAGNVRGALDSAGLTETTPDRPFFWTLIVLFVLVVGLIAIANSLR